MPLLSKLFADNDTTIRQTDIVMLLTPRIVRSHELTARDFSNIYIGTQQNMALGGPPPLLAGPPEPPPEAAAPATPQQPQLQLPPGSSPIPGLTSVPPAPVTPPPTGAAPPGVAAPAQPPAPTTPTAPKPFPVPPEPTPAQPAPAQPPPAQPTPAQPPAAPPAAEPATAARVTLAVPGEMRVGGGPFTVPVSIAGASRLTTITVSITYNPAMLRVRSVQEGSFMRQGGSAPSFTQQVDPTAGRIDIAITRAGDQVGAAGTGLLAAILFDAVAPGTATLSTSGVGTTAGGGMAALTFVPSTVVVK
jgi:hypothetical protein